MPIENGGVRSGGNSDAYNDRPRNEPLQNRRHLYDERPQWNDRSDLDVRGRLVDDSYRLRAQYDMPDTNSGAKRRDPYLQQQTFKKILPEIQITGLPVKPAAPPLNYSTLLDTTQDQMAENVESVFKKIDLNKDGFVDEAETAKAVANPEIKHKDALIVGLLKDAYSTIMEQSNDEIGDENSGVTVKDFRSLFKTLKDYNDLQEIAWNIRKHLKPHFERIDKDRNGFLSAGELNSFRFGDVTLEESSTLDHARKNFDALMHASDDEWWESKGVTKKDMDEYFGDVFIAGPWKLNDKVENTIAGLQLSLYKKSTDRLYGDTIDPRRSVNPLAVKQGLIGDCYFLSPISSMASTEAGKQKIMNMIKDNGPDKDGRHTYTVTFPAAKNEPITVSAPTDSELALYNKATEHGVWPAVLEKAYAKYVNSDITRRMTMSPYKVDYDAISGGSAIASGHRVLSESGAATRQRFSRTPDEEVKASIVNALADGRPISISALNTTASIVGLGENLTDENKLYRGHSYSIIGFDAATNMVKIRNPWGHGGEPEDSNHGARDGIDDGIFSLSLEALKKDFDSIQFARK